MKKRSITLIIWLMSIALIGVMGMQYYFIRESYYQKAQIFDETVKASLSAVANKIERQEIVQYSSEQEKINQQKYVEDQRIQREKELILAEQINIQEEISKLRLKNFEAIDQYSKEEKELRLLYPHAAHVTNTFFETYIRRREYNPLVTFNIEKRFEDPTLPMISVTVGASRRIPEVMGKDDSTRFVIPVLNEYTLKVHTFLWATLPPASDKKAENKIAQLEERLRQLTLKQNLADATNLYDTLVIIGGKDSQVIENFAISQKVSKRPLRERVNRKMILNYLLDEFHNRGINSPFVMQIRSKPSSPPIIQAMYNITEDNLQSISNSTEYSTTLFQGDQGSPPGFLSIYFQSKQRIIADNMGYMILPVLALLALLVGCFAYTLSIIFRQKKISEMKTDFINNMTHEFKTPVATIMIASESLRDPEIASNENRVNKLANIIYDENVRLGSHIERVLNIARLEKENLKIERTQVHINTLISSVIESMQLQLDKAEGQMSLDLQAKNDVVIGDELHLSNVFFNLVDNAIKYSTEQPDISVKTFTTRHDVHITVTDKGVGMSKEHQEKIFDQFYRIPTGNIHNVKGFGLGLSYVHNIIKILDGNITVKSEKDKGTQFEVILPLDLNYSPVNT